MQKLCQNLDYTYGGAESKKGNLRSVLTGLTEQHNKLTVTKGTGQSQKQLMNEIVGSKSKNSHKSNTAQKAHLQTTGSSHC